MANDLLSLSSVDTPWFVHVAAEPLLQLLKANPHLNVTELASTPPSNPFLFDRNQLQKRDSCYRNDNNNNNNNNNNNPPSSGPSGALIGGIVGGVLGGILLIVLAWFLWRRKRNQRLQKQQQQNLNNPNTNTMGFPPGAMPTPYDPGQGVTPPMMKQTGPGGFAMMNNGSGTGPNFTSAAYPAPPSSAGWSGTGSGTNSTAPLTSNPVGGNPQERQSYYNYAPPPPDNGMAGFMPSAANNGGQWNSSTNLTGTTAAGGPMYSGTPSPPPPSSTPGATSNYSGGTGYAPWAIPHSSSPGPSVSGIASGSSSPAPPPHGPPGGMFFPSAAEEKAHYSRRNGKEDEARAGMTAPTPAPPAYEPYRGQ